MPETPSATRSDLSFLESRWWGAVVVIAGAGLVFSALIVALAVRHGFGYIFSDNLPYEVGRALPLVAVGAITLQFVLSARLRWVARPFGLNRVLRFHKAVGAFVLLLLIAHPALVAWGYYGWTIFFSTATPWYVWLGKLALLLLFVQVLTGLFRQSFRLRFERWRLLHNQALVIFGALFVHSRLTGTDLLQPAMRTVWWALLAVVVAAYGYHKVVAPTLSRLRAYRVTEVKAETHDVWTLHMEPPPGRARFTYRPGQFHFLTLRRRGLPTEEHHFTISSSPTEPALTSTIKHSGDFTATIGQTRPGDRAAIEGPFGRFSYTFRPRERNLVFIAGGIGITPLMSMLRHLRDTAADANVLLLYGNKTEADIVFRGELEEMAGGERPRLRVVHVLSRPGAGWQGEAGYVDRAKIERLAGDRLVGNTYYVCGPPPMARGVIAALRDLGVPGSRIEYERFWL